MATEKIGEIVPPFLSSNSEPPAVLDGTTRLYLAYYCPFAHRAWLTRNYKGLHAKIQLVPIDLNDKPAWYKEKVNPANKVPALEHNNKIIGESLDLIRYIDAHFEGPSLFPDVVLSVYPTHVGITISDLDKDPAKKELTEELFAYSNKWNSALLMYLKGATSEDEMVPALDKLEEYLSRYNDEGPFFLGAQFSAADIVYAPFVQRYRPLCIDLRKYDIMEGRPKLAAWLKALDTVEAFKETKWDMEQNIMIFKRNNLGIV